MSRYRDDDHYGDRKKPDATMQEEGLPLFAPAQPSETERQRLERDRSIDARFQLFHMDHPEVLEELERRVRALTDAGVKRCSIRMVWDAMRYENTLRGPRAAGEFKLNDQYTSRYARLMIERNPHLRGVLETRELRSA